MLSDFLCTNSTSTKATLSKSPVHHLTAVSDGSVSEVALEGGKYAKIL